MFTFTASDVIRFYGEKFLFLPNNRVGEKGEQPLLPELETIKVVEKEETIKTNSVLYQQPEQSPVNPIIVPKVEPISLEKTEIIIPKPIEKILTNPLESGEKVQWKMRPNVPCKVVVIVAAHEFKNTVLMGALLFMMEEKCKIPRTSISFGVYQSHQTTWNLTDMPVKTAVLFADIEIENPNLTGKTIHILPSISKIALDIPLQEKAMALFKEL